MKLNARLNAIIALALLAGSPISAARADRVATEQKSIVEISPIAPASDVTSRVFATSDGGSVHVSRLPLISISDIVSADVGQAEGSTVLELKLKAASAARVRAFTASHVGSHVAYVVNGHVNKVVKILDPIKGDGIIVGPVSANEGYSVANAINSQVSGSLK